MIDGVVPSFKTIRAFILPIEIIRERLLREQNLNANLLVAVDELSSRTESMAVDVQRARIQLTCELVILQKQQARLSHIESSILESSISNIHKVVAGPISSALASNQYHDVNAKTFHADVITAASMLVLGAHTMETAREVVELFPIWKNALMSVYTQNRLEQLSHAKKSVRISTLFSSIPKALKETHLEHSLWRVSFRSVFAGASIIYLMENKAKAAAVFDRAFNFLFYRLYEVQKLHPTDDRNNDVSNLSK